MIISAKSDIGKSRHENQDSYAVGQIQDGIYAVVCDGMGGVSGGQIASSLAVKAFSESLESIYKPEAKSMRNLFEIICDKSNSAVYNYAKENPELLGMGTTLVACVALTDKIIILHAGDSRAYLFRDSKLTALTKDHSMVQQLVDQGYISEEQAEHHMYKNLITRALGTDETVKVDFSEFDIQPYDTFLLCTDGLTNYVSKNEIIDILSTQEPNFAVDSLIETANSAGGGDNITAVIIKNV